MIANADKAKADLERLLKKGRMLLLSLRMLCYPDEVKAALTRQMKDNAPAYIKGLPPFDAEYQRWYTEAMQVIKQLLPDRLGDFVGHFERPKARRELTPDTYRIEDCLQGQGVVRGTGKDRMLVKDPAIPHLQQQLAILDAAAVRFDSALMDVRAATQAEVVDATLAAADQLLNQGHARAAGAVAGMVLERHLTALCIARRLPPVRKASMLEDLADVLRQGEAIDIPQWRLLHHLAELRGHIEQKKPEPAPDAMNDLVAGARKVVRTVF